MKPYTVLIMLLFASYAVATGADVDNLPADVPADAQIEEEAYTEEAPDRVEVETDMTFERILPQDMVEVGETFKVTLKLTNDYTEKLDVLVVEPVRSGGEYVNAPEPYTIQYEGLPVKLLRWQDTLQAGDTKEYTYQIKPTVPGEITFAIASVNDQYGNTFESDPGLVKVGCRPNGVCDKDENYLTCPEDCPSGSKDDVCDHIEDGVADPDCTPEADADYSKLPATIPRQPIKQEQEEEKGFCNLLILPLITLFVAAVAKI